MSKLPTTEPTFFVHEQRLNEAVAYIRPAAPTLAAITVALTTFIAGALSIETRRQLGTMGAFQSTWFDLGLNVAAVGVFGTGSHPTVYKPPGYPLFVAGAVRALAGKPSLCETCDTGPHWGRLAYRRRFLERSARALGWAQAWAHACAAGALCLCLSRLMGLKAATLGGLLFGADPVLLVLVGATHYTILHLLFVTVGLALLVRCIPEPPRGRRGAAWWWLSGVWWGLATLVRPVTLLLPPFVLGAALAGARGRVRTAMAGSGWFVLGMALAILPHSVRNYRIGGQWIPVNAQFWTAVFGSTALESRASPDRLRWRDVLSQAREVASLSIGRELSGVYEPLSVRENLLLEKGYRDAAIANLLASPETYLRNVRRSLWSYHIHTTAAYLPIFRHYQQPGNTWPRWGSTGTAADPATWPGGDIYRVLGRLLTMLGFAGAGLALFRRDARMLAPAAVHACLAVAHALSWMDFTYLYLRIPFNCLFAMYFIDSYLNAPAHTPARLGALAAAAVLVALLCSSLVEVFLT
jgi:hypothetical protein